MGRIVRPNPDGKVQYTPINPMKYVSIDIEVDIEQLTKVFDKPE